MAGYALVDLGKPADAEAQFTPVANWFKRKHLSDAQGLAYNEMVRLHWALHDPQKARRKQWLASAKIMNRMDDNEANLASELIGNAGQQAGMNMQQIQNEQMNLHYWYGGRPPSPADTIRAPIPITTAATTHRPAS